MCFFLLQNEDKYLLRNKTFEVSSSSQSVHFPGESTDKEDLNNTNISVATMSKLDIVIVPLEKKNPKSDHLVANNRTSILSTPSEGDPEIAINGPQLKEERLQSISKPQPKTENVDFQKIVDATDNRDDTMKLLQPVSEVQTSDQVIILC